MQISSRTWFSRCLIGGASIVATVALGVRPAAACGAAYPGASGNVQPGIAPIGGGGMPSCGGSSSDTIMLPYIWRDSSGSAYPTVFDENFRTCNFAAGPSYPNDKVLWHCTGDSTGGTADWNLQAIHGTGLTQVRVNRPTACADLEVSNPFNNQDNTAWHLHWHYPDGVSCPPGATWSGGVETK